MRDLVSHVRTFLTGIKLTVPARLFGATAAVRQRTGEVRFHIYQAGYAAPLAALRDAMGEEDFDCAWAEGAALSTDEAIAYARRSPANANRRRPAKAPLNNAAWHGSSAGLRNRDRSGAPGLRVSYPARGAKNESWSVKKRLSERCDDPNMA